MKVHPRAIYNGAKPEFIVLPIKEYSQLIAICEELLDIQEMQKYLDNPEETFPIEIVLALANNENPIKVYREYRNLSQVKLAKEVDVSKQYISQLETGQRAGTTKVLKKIASVLKVDLDDIAKLA